MTLREELIRRLLPPFRHFADGLRLFECSHCGRRSCWSKAKFPKCAFCDAKDKEMIEVKAGAGEALRPS